ncbi:MAG: DUF3617 family protein [Sphingomonas sp.]|uniref:DUF3617 domain-containing protein n=1 Tax=Sphingomonas sp. TaxID=28214 RepID=UPI001205AD17|nr:DUF3617 family protein [Sphingomonas sp.]THD37854.1 MAG: DUF3617 family protein [Sphingomonas sp.]
MRRAVLAVGTAAIVLAGCAKSGPPPKRQPGSWSQKIELKRLEGPKADAMRPRMEQMLAMMSAISLCVTPEMAAKEAPTQDLDKFGGGRDCSFDRKSVAGGNLDVAGTCKGADGATKKLTATGTLGASDQDIDMTVENYDATGAKQGLMEMRVHSVRNGECTAKDMTAPATAM